MKLNQVLLAASFITTTFSAGVHASSISITGGSLTAHADGGTDKTTQITGFGNYSADSSYSVTTYDYLFQRDVMLTADGYSSASLNDHAITIGASASGAYSIAGETAQRVDIGASASGVLNFSLSDTANVQLSFLGSIFPGGTNALATLSGLSGFQLTCTFVPLQGADPCNNTLTLNAGSYALSFNTSTAIAVGTRTNGNLHMTLEIQPVPIPTAIYLFSSGLIGLGGLSRARKSV